MKTGITKVKITSGEYAGETADAWPAMSPDRVEIKLENGNVIRLPETVIEIL